ncbi:TPR repeat [Candidatus Burkholderia verschuerenii]|uniref:TPR repeat n=1 Tax=Candidatus Burkholderia verschuerenii TaxID=242163 RepID=A0A0L0MIQ3_9BURK|nr:TPR repeat [Candidatus Burkholderia verschuerenii]
MTECATFFPSRWIHRIMQAAQVRYSAAVAHYHEGRFEHALSELAPDLNAPDAHADVLNLAAICALKLDRPHEARALWHRAMIARPYDAGIPSNLGNLLTRLNEYEEAQTAYRRAIEIQPSSVEARFNLSLLYVRQERWAEAEAELARTIELSGDHADAHRHRGKALEALERPPMRWCATSMSFVCVRRTRRRSGNSSKSRESCAMGARRANMP